MNLSGADAEVLMWSVVVSKVISKNKMLKMFKLKGQLPQGERTVNTFTYLKCVAESVEQVVVCLHFIPVQLPAGGGADHQWKAVQHTLTHPVCTQNPVTHAHTQSWLASRPNNEGQLCLQCNHFLLL